MLEDGPHGLNGSPQNGEEDQDGLEEGGDVSLYGVDWEDMEDKCQGHSTLSSQCVLRAPG